MHHLHRFAKPSQMFGEAAVVVLMNYWRLLRDQLQPTYHSKAAVQWTSGQDSLQRDIEAAVRKAFGGEGRLMSKAHAAVRAVIAHVDSWHAQLRTAASRSRRSSGVTEAWRRLQIRASLSSQQPRQRQQLTGSLQAA